MVAAILALIRSLIQYEFELGYSVDAIAAGPYNISLRTIYKIRRIWSRYSTVFIPSENLYR